jgi:hypothetical protein
MDSQQDTSQERVAEGGVRILATGATQVEALSAALSQILPYLQGSERRSGSGRSVSLRAEVGEFPDLLPALTIRVLEQIEEQGQGIASVEVSGVVRSDHGLIGWGTAELANEKADAARPVAFIGLDVRDEPGAVTIEAAFLPAEENA